MAESALDEARAAYRDAVRAHRRLVVSMSATGRRDPSMAAVMATLDDRLAGVRVALRDVDPDADERVEWLVGQCAATEQRVLALRDCVASATRAVEAVRVATDRVERARRLGTFDALGGGLFVSWAKQDAVSEGVEILNELDADLIAVRSELGDLAQLLRISVPAGLESGSRAWTWDVWLDNVFSDVDMLDRIDGLLDRLATLDHHLRTVQPEIENRMNEASAAFDRLRAELNALLLGTATIIERI